MILLLVWKGLLHWVWGPWGVGRTRPAKRTDIPARAGRAVRPAGDRNIIYLHHHDNRRRTLQSLNKGQG